MNYSPKEIVAELDKYIIGQDKAKRAVAIALRNRYRRSQLSEELREEITPKNIIMQGPTGVGKTEIARRLAKLVSAPFVKVEATKFTEVGYVGRDCESMVRDLVEASARIVTNEFNKQVSTKADEIAVNRLIDVLYPRYKDNNTAKLVDEIKEQIRQDILSGKIDDEEVEVMIKDNPMGQVLGAIPVGPMGAEMDGDPFAGLGALFDGRRKPKKMTVKKARAMFVEEESSKLIDKDRLNDEIVRRAEQEGIIFIDEIDKIATRGSTGKGPDVSREGVQRDILPLVEGSTVKTKYGMVKTDYMLFIAAGAFHISKVEDLIPELQGRFPIRVELNNLRSDDFFKILTQPKNALTMQYVKLLEVDHIHLKYTDEALHEIADMAERENETSENIGARRLHTILEALLEDISYNAGGDTPDINITIDKPYVQKVFADKIKKYDLKKYIL